MISAHDARIKPATIAIVAGRSSAIPGVAAAVKSAGFVVDGHGEVILLVDAPIGFALFTLEVLDRRGCRVIVTTTNPCPEYVADLADQHPEALLVSVSLTHRLGDAMAALDRGRYWQAGEIQPSCLTLRERTVLRCIARGWMTKQIAGELGFEHHSIENLAGRVYRKLGVDGRLQAALYYWGVFIPELGHAPKQATFSLP
jgi:DNA-binding CsgD family transcriptional regulator